MQEPFIVMRKGDYGSWAAKTARCAETYAEGRADARAELRAVVRADDYAENGSDAEAFAEEMQKAR